MDREPLVPIRLDNYKPLRELVFESLREAIINGKLGPSERLMEIQLAEEMGRQSYFGPGSNSKIGTRRISGHDPP